MATKVVRGEESFSIATLLVDDDATDHTKSRPTVKYSQLSPSCNEPVAALDQLPETYFVSNWEAGRGQEEHISSLEKSCFKSARLSQIAANDAAVFLSGEYPGSKRTKKGLSTKASSPSASIGNEVLIMSSTSGDSTFRKAQYHAFTFSFPQAEFDLCAPTKESSTYRQLLEVRQCGLQRSGALSLSKDLLSFDAFDVVEICTGMCLFSEPALNMCIENGMIKPKLLAAQPFSLSERDIIIRLAMTIANMAALYIYGTKTKGSCPVRINIDIPCIQYYQNALESFENGMCSASDALEWFAAIKKRRLLLFRAFRNAIEHELKQRGLHQNSVEICLSSGLQAAEEVILTNVLIPHGPVDWIQEILNSVLEDGDEFWAEAIGLQDEKEREPSTWRQFCTLSYVYEVLKPVLRARAVGKKVSDDDTTRCTSKSAPPSPKLKGRKQDDYFGTGSSSEAPRRVLLLAVDDQDESRIYTKANRALSQLHATSARSPGAGPPSSAPTTTRILTIYPAPQIVIGTSTPSTNWRRPSLWRAPLQHGGEQGAELQFRNEEHLVESCSDVLKNVYGAGLVEHLQSWLRK